MDGLHHETLEVAESLLLGTSLSRAAVRRAVSSAYYSLFQRLSSLCASRLSGALTQSEEYLRLYRALDHRQARAALNKSAFRAELGVRFEQLQDLRHWADYSVASHPDPDASDAGRGFSATDAALYLAKAREAIQFVDALDDAAQLKLAVLLVVRER
jgi:hypothetical protein